MTPSSTIPVALARCPTYDRKLLSKAIPLLLETVGCLPAAGTRVLVKPNLLAPRPPDFLPCTHPEVVRAVCAYLVDCGARVRVGDSPSLGRGVEIARKIGLIDALSPLPVKVINLHRPRFLRTSFGGPIAVSREVLESDLILNLPKLKTHHQMRVTGAVKNVYGCVPGLLKALFHLLYGDRNGRFRKMFYDIWQHLPDSITLMDAVIAMHAEGPVKGLPFPLGLLAASISPIAVDTAAMSIIGLPPEKAPLWKIARSMNLPGARQGDLAYPLAVPAEFSVNGFRLPEDLLPVSFRPLKMAAHLYRRYSGK